MGKLRLILNARSTLRILKVATVVSPVLFILLLELLIYVFFKEIFQTWVALSLFAVAGVTAFFFSRFVFYVLDLMKIEDSRRMRELTILNELNDALDEIHNLGALLERSMAKLVRITQADSGELYLLDEQNGQLVHALHHGPDDVAEDVQTKLEKSLVDKHGQLKQQVIVDNVKEFRQGLIAFLAESGVSSLAVIPLQSRGGSIGVIYLFSLKPGNFKPADANLLLNIGKRIAVAIENARLYEKARAVAITEERERISSELHDGLAQVLGYVITKSQATRQLLRNVSAAGDYLVELENMAQEVYTDTREAILGLRTAISGDRSMVSALREYAVRFNQMNGIKTDIVVGDRIVPSLSPQTELQVIRIVQEALSNVRKHAQATHVAIRIVAGVDFVTITVEDDGRGFDIDKIGNGDWRRFGLRNMNERAVSIHSGLAIESKPGYGTRVTLKIPMTSASMLKEKGEESESTDSR